MERQQPQLITAMADRKDTVVLTAVMGAAVEGPKPSRLAAITALGRVGNASCLQPLLQIAVEKDDDLVKAAKTSLGNLPGDDVNMYIVARLPKSEPMLFVVLIELIGDRLIQATPELQKALENSDKAIRTAALVSLGATIPQKNLSVLINLVISPKHAEDATAAQKALETASIRMPDREACAQELTTSMDRASVPTKSVLLSILADVGGKKALETVGLAAKSKEPELQDTSTKLLGKWATSDAAPVLLDLAKTAPEEKYQIRAIGGYIRIARSNDHELTKSGWKCAATPSNWLGGLPIRSCCWIC